MSAKKYSLGIVGRKAGMSRVFTEDGKSIPVTLIEATPNRITQVKTVETDGYSAVQVTAGVARLAGEQAGGRPPGQGQGGGGSWPVGTARGSRPDRWLSKWAARSRPTSSAKARSSTSRA
jgi:large subunit ribosomal protein L3